MRLVELAAELFAAEEVAWAAAQARMARGGLATERALRRALIYVSIW